MKTLGPQVSWARFSARHRRLARVRPGPGSSERDSPSLPRYTVTQETTGNSQAWPKTPSLWVVGGFQAVGICDSSSRPG